MLNNYDTSILFLRAGIAFLYVYAAYMNSKDKISLQWTIDNTKPLFRNTKYSENIPLIKFFAYCGIAIMYIGGLSILIGIEARLGAFMLLAFTIGGTVIHNRQRNDAKEIALKNSANAELSSTAWSAFAAHFANILKNVCLILILIYVMLNGVGKYQLSDCIFNLIINN